MNSTLLQASFADVLQREPQLTQCFYERLFREYPQTRALFHSEPMEVQAMMLAEALTAGTSPH